MSAESVIARLAAAQWGTAARRQLLGHGVTPRQIERRLASGRLISLYRGVYAVGHRHLRAEGLFMAAVLAGGPGSVLSHRSASTHRGLLVSARARVDVTVPRGLRSRSGLEIHRLRLPDSDWEWRDGIPTTSVARTIFDLAAVEPARRVERAIEQAVLRQVYDATALAELTRRYPRRKGSGVIRALLAAAAGDDGMSYEGLEEQFLDFLDEYGLSRPERNVRVVAGSVDCAWRAARLIVELDSRAFHSSMEAFERDRDRDRVHATAGWGTLRITARALRERRAELATQLAQLTARH